MKYHQNSTELELVKGCLKGHHLAQKFFYQRFHGKMLSVCMRYASDRDEAVEILNTGFLKVFNKLDRFKQQGSLEGWIRRIMVNTAIDHIRKYATYNKTMVHDSYTEGSVDNGALDHLLGEDIHKIIQKLPPTSRTVFCLYLIEGYTHKEIAEQLGMSVGTSKWHLAEAKKRFRALATNLAKDWAKVG